MNKTNLLWGLIALLTLGACQDDTLKDDSFTNGVNGKTFIELNIEEGTSSRLMYEGFVMKNYKLKDRIKNNFVFIANFNF